MLLSCPPGPCLANHPWPPVFHSIPTFKGELGKARGPGWCPTLPGEGEADTTGVRQACWQGPEKQRWPRPISQEFSHEPSRNSHTSAPGRRIGTGSICDSRTPETTPPSMKLKLANGVHGILCSQEKGGLDLHESLGVNLKP